MSEHSSGIERRIRLIGGPRNLEIITVREPGFWLTAPSGIDGEINYRVVAFNGEVETAEFQGFSQRQPSEWTCS